MRQLRLIQYSIAALLFAHFAFAQGARTGSRGSGRPAGSGGAQSGSTNTGNANPAPVGITPKFAVGTITSSGFPARLGATVGSPLLAMPPGVGNINHPGVAPPMQPMPAMQPLPTSIPGIPNINFPGGVPSMNGPAANGPHRGDGQRDGRGEFRKTPGVIYYGVPYYVPYVVYTLDAGTMTILAKPAEPNAAASTDPAPVPAAAAQPLTVLVFKDRTVVMVRDYWLEGDRFWYETAEGVRASIFLDQLDLPFTQQLNRERNVRFVLESRP